jgi:hypothetical protein
LGWVWASTAVVSGPMTAKAVARARAANFMRSP